MIANSSTRFTLLKAIGLFMGASFFAYLLSIAIHESGHYLASIILGVPEKGIALNPFGANYNIYLGDTSTALGTPLRRAFSGASGPVFDLLVAVTLSLLLWQKRSPGLLPLLLLGSYALLHESVAMIMAAIGDSSSGDWINVMVVGVPPGIIILLAAIMLAAACVWILQILPLTGINPHWSTGGCCCTLPADGFAQLLTYSGRGSSLGKYSFVMIALWRFNREEF